MTEIKRKKRKVTFISNFHDEQDGYADLNFKEDKSGWQKDEPAERIYVKYDPKKKLTNHEANIPNQRDKEVKELENVVCVTNEDNQNLTPS